MTQPASVKVTIEVPVDPSAAFDAFTREIDTWYKRGPHSFADPARAIGVRFEPGVGGRLLEVYDADSGEGREMGRILAFGRLLEVYDADSGEGREMGRILAWEPGARLVFRDHRGSEVDVCFERLKGGAGGTRVSLEHRGLERLPPDVAQRSVRFGWRTLLGWFDEHMNRSPRPG